MDRSHEERNARSRQRLRDLVAGLDDAMLSRPLDGDWTIGAILAHLAFWDEWARRRWDRYEREGIIDPIPEGVMHMINESSLPTWRAIAPRRAVELALAAAESGDRRIEALTDEQIAFAQSSGRQIMLDRTRHRDPHLDEIERSLAGG